ncbi:MAG: SufS family cysteine desulfurase [Bacteroidales bacterium]|nr:SufS family cysteine desulfurase [Bacteroidales bacterium]
MEGVKNIISEVRSHFPALETSMNGRRLVYLDNAATTQKSREVLEFISGAMVNKNANVHRSMYALSDLATEAYEAAREKVRSFINAPERENIIFTSGTTASINLVASSFCQAFLKEGDAVLIEADSHHSNIVPWQLAAQRVGAFIKVLPIDGSGNLCTNLAESLLTPEVKIVALTQVSNVLGVENTIAEIINLAHKKGIPVLVDGAQGVVHSEVDVQKMDCDFYAFSAHKIYGATGVGILYGKRDWLEKMPPYMGGGDMVETVTYQKTTYAPLPLKFEAGTPNFTGAASLLPALETAEYLRRGEVGEALKKEERAIVSFMMEKLSQIPDIEIYGTPDDLEKKHPIFSLNIKGVNAGDMAQILDKMGVAVRSGLMCAEPLINSFGATSALRASFAPYNTLEEADYFVQCLQRALQMLK